MAGLFSSAVAPTERRKALRAALAAPEIARMPGAFSPLAARAIRKPDLKACTSRAPSWRLTLHCRISA